MKKKKAESRAERKPEPEPPVKDIEPPVRVHPVLRKRPPVEKESR